MELIWKSTFPITKLILSQVTLKMKLFDLLCLKWKSFHTTKRCLIFLTKSIQNLSRISTESHSLLKTINNLFLSIYMWKSVRFFLKQFSLIKIIILIIIKDLLLSDFVINKPFVLEKIGSLLNALIDSWIIHMSVLL